MNTNEPQHPHTETQNPNQQTPPPYGPSYRSYYGPQQGPYYGPQRPYKPDSYLILAIISTFFGFLPFGIVAIVYATKVDNLYYQGQYEAAIDASSKAKKWSIISLVCVAALVTFWLFLAFLIAAGAIASLPALLG